MVGFPQLPSDVLMKLIGDEPLGRLLAIRVVSKQFERAASKCAGARCLSLCVRGPTDEHEILPLLRQLVNLEELDLSCAGDEASEVLRRMGGLDCRTSLTLLSMEEDVQGQDWLKGLMELKQLRALSVRGCDIGNATMSKIAARYSCLGSVDVSKTAVSDDGVTMLALLCNLRELSLRECPIGDAALESLAQGAKGLQVLDLCRCKGRQTDAGWQACTNEGVLTLSAACTDLETLVLSWCGQVTLECVEALSAMPKLERLLLAGLACQRGGGGTPLKVPDLSQFSSLTVLDMSIARPFWSISDRVVSSLCNSLSAPSLTELRLVSCSVTEDGVALLAGALPELVLLDLTGSGVKDRGVQAIARGCPSLMVLRLNTCGGVSDLGFADVSSRLTCLRELDIKSSLATDSGLAKLCATERHQGALHVLSVAHCRKITPQGLQWGLRKSGGCGSEIRVLNAAGLIISHELVECLAQLPELRWLNVTDSRLVPGARDLDVESQPMINPSFEYAAVILPLPSMTMAKKEVMRPSRSLAIPPHGAGGGTNDEKDSHRFPLLETLHTDRCMGLSYLLRMVSSTGARSLRKVTMSGPEALGADVLVLAQCCKSIQTLILRRCKVDQSVARCLEQRGIAVQLGADHAPE